MRSKNPFMQWNFGAFKDCSDSYSKLCAAISAEVKTCAGRFTLQKAIALCTAAMRAYCTIRPADRFKMLTRCIVVLKAWFGKECGSHICSPINVEPV